MTYERYSAAEYDINEGLIRLGLSLERGEAKPKDPRARMEEMARFLESCRHPQRGVPAIHVAGTSGKGSVAAGIAGILWAAGLKVGLHVSPYLQSATEKIWINGRFISSDSFADLVDWVMPIAKPLVHPDTRASIHGMASVAIALEAFRRERVDVMVFEAGCGGRFDLTSFVETAVGVITNVGLDHVISLGPTLEQIAWHKAGIARPGIPLVTGASGSALGVIESEAREVEAPLVRIDPQPDALAHNRAIAMETARQFAHRSNIPFDESAADDAYNRVTLAGRCEHLKSGDGPAIVLDGAHNAEKLTVAVRAALRHRGAGPRVAVIGFLGTKAKPELIAPLSGRFDVVVATQPTVYGKRPCKAAQTANLLREAGFEPLIEPDAQAALDLGIRQAGRHGMVFVAGSFYLVGELRERFYPKRAVVMNRTSWP